jgi:hypothetical protein
MKGGKSSKGSSDKWSRKMSGLWVLRLLRNLQGSKLSILLMRVTGSKKTRVNDLKTTDLNAFFLIIKNFCYLNQI